MENQHRKISGYRELSAEEIALINEIKAKGIELEQLLGKVRDHLGPQLTAALNKEQAGDRTEVDRLDAAHPGRWASIAATDFQTGLMALTRAVAQPTFF